MYRRNIWHPCPPPRWTGEKGILPATHTPPGPGPAAQRQRPDWSCGLISAETARSSISGSLDPSLKKPVLDAADPKNLIIIVRGTPIFKC